ncbi:MAG: hypothetical protein QF491_24245, partial [Alphaproteobacteria bacterium]|nr:hypothetical protein [Alphaproteobacteria bacterium]
MTFHRTRAVLVALALLVQPVPALASTILGGNDVIARPYLDGADGVLFFDLNGRISGNGEIDSWSIYANATGGEVKLLIYRDNGANWDFVGESGLEAVNSLGVNTFALASPITVETDDIIAWWYPEPTQPSIAFSDGGETINN